MNLEYLDQLIVDAQQELNACSDLPELENVKAKYLGKTGDLTKLLREIGGLAAAERPEFGARINVAKQSIEASLIARRDLLAQHKLMRQLAVESIDITLPGRNLGEGGLHPISQVTQRIEAIFTAAGFVVADGPEIEDDYHNFTALNQPENHPARSMHDTFYVEGGFLLRTHTSPVQVRYMQKNRPPLRIIAPGRAYRVDSDATHSPMFHQVEGLWVDEKVSFADLKSVIHGFLRQFFESDAIQLRFRPSFFPFTEPSAEIDMSFGNDKWLEIAGSGQVHPQVLINCGLDPEECQGIAFGMGIDRLAMLRYGIQDLRLFYENDLRFLEQFRGQ